MKTLSETADFLLVHDQTNHWLYIRWRGRQPQQSIQEACALVLAYVQRTRCPKILSDSTHDEDGWGKLVHWLASDFFHQLADKGVQTVAWVLPTNLRARADVQTLADAIDRPQTTVFADMESAYSWLKRW